MTRGCHADSGGRSTGARKLRAQMQPDWDSKLKWRTEALLWLADQLSAVISDRK